MRRRACCDSDAVTRTGVPILTLGRESMISRVAASLALAAGLPALVALTMSDYHRIAAALVPRGPRPGPKLRRLRAATLQARATSAVFDTALWVRHLDRALAAAWDSDAAAGRDAGGQRRGKGGTAPAGRPGKQHHIVVAVEARD